MRQLSPIRSVSPISKPKIVFKYPSPLKQVSGNNICEPHVAFVPQFQAKPDIVSHHSPSKQNSSIMSESNALCYLCGKNASYKIVTNGFLCCSACGINQMKSGVEVTRIQLKTVAFPKDTPQKIPKQNPPHPTPTGFNLPAKLVSLKSRPASSSTVKHEETESKNEIRQNQLQHFVDQVDSQEKELRKIIQMMEDQSFSEQNIKTVFKDKKMALKKHYEKIKATIKLSIQKDLQELDKKQKEQLQSIQSKKKELKQDVLKLTRIKSDIQPNIPMIVANVQPQKYQEFMSKYKSQASKIYEAKQIANHLLQQVSMSTISRTTDNPGDISQIKLTLESDVQRQKSYLYDPELYMLLGDSKGGAKAEIFFSFEKR